MRLVHESGTGERTTVSATVETADSFVSKARGLMFRRSLPDDYALAFRFDGPARRAIHTVFVLTPLDVVWVTDDVVTRVERLAPWRGFARAEADLIVEFPAGGATGIDVDDRLYLTES